MNVGSMSSNNNICMVISFSQGSDYVPVALHSKHRDEIRANKCIMIPFAIKVNHSHAKRTPDYLHCIPIWNIRQQPLFYDFVKKSIHSSEQTVLRTLLREIRQQKGLTQLELSRKLGRSQSFVSKYEVGELSLDVLELKAICQAMGVSLRDFISRFEDRVP